jgi:hypothetical protein
MLKTGFMLLQENEKGLKLPASKYTQNPFLEPIASRVPTSPDLAIKYLLLVSILIRLKLHSIS